MVYIYMLVQASNGEGLLLGPRDSVRKNPYIVLDIVNGQYQSGTQPLVTVLVNKNIKTTLMMMMTVNDDDDCE